MTGGLGFVFSAQIRKKGLLEEERLLESAAGDVREMARWTGWQLRANGTLEVESVRQLMARTKVHASCFDRPAARWDVVDVGYDMDMIFVRMARQGVDPIGACRRLREACAEIYPYADFGYWVYSASGRPCEGVAQDRSTYTWRWPGIVWISQDSDQGG